MLYEVLTMKDTQISLSNCALPSILSITYGFPHTSKYSIDYAVDFKRLILETIR
jgi:hypothetical protein